MSRHGCFRALIVIGLIGALELAAPAIAQDSAPPSSVPDANAPRPAPSAPEATAPAPAAPAPAPPVTPPPAPPAAKVLERTETQGVLGRDVRSKTGENMGRVVEVIVDRATGQARAAIIDFGGFLGVGSRKIAVAWDALQFTTGQNSDRITLDLTRDQVKDAPDYKEGKPIIALGRSGASQPIPDER